MKNIPFILHTLLSLTAVLFSQTSFAQEATWTGGSVATDDWTDGDNWGGSSPVANDILQFDGAQRLTPNNNFAANTAFSGIDFLSGAGAFTLGGNAIDLSGNITSAAAGIQTVNLDLALTTDINIDIEADDATSQITFNGGISGPHGLTISGTEQFGNNRITFNGTNTYTGLTTVGMGGPATLWVTDPSALPGDVSVLDGGQLRLRPAAGTTFSNNITIVGQGAESLGQPGWMGRSYSGALVLNNGAEVTGDITLAGDTVISAGRPDSSTSGLSGTISGRITGDYSVQFGYEGGRPGSITLSNPANDWSGDTVIVAGGRTNSSSRIFTLNLTADNVLPFGAGKGDLTISQNNARLDANGNTVNINGLNNIGSTVNIVNGGAFTLGHNDADGNYAGNMTVETLTKVGTGNQQLNGVTTVTDANVESGILTIGNGGDFRASGTVSVSGGSLVLDGGEIRYNGSGDLVGSVTLSAGTISGTNWNGGLSGITVGAGVVIAPGNSPGQADTGSQIWADGGTYQFEINDANGIAGVNWDIIAISGNLDLSGLSTGGFTLDLISLDGSNQAALLSGFDQDSPFSWEIAEAGSIVGSITPNMFEVDTTNFLNDLNGSFSVDQSGNALVLNYSPIPEPGHFALIFAGVALTLALRHRQKQV